MSTPYAGTEGFSGTDTSRERAESKAATARHRQNSLLRYLRARRAQGATVAEIKETASPRGTGALPREFEHHGTASGTLSILHRTGQIARLTETRGRAHVYVLPEFVDGRAFERFVGNAEKAAIRALDDMAEQIEHVRSGARPVDRLGLDLAGELIRERIQRLVSGDDLD